MTAKTMEYCLGISREPCSPLKPKLLAGSCAYCGLPGGTVGIHEHVTGAGKKIGLCLICHSGLHLDLLGQSSEPLGDIVYLPELTQKQVNMLWISLQIATDRKKRLEKVKASEDVQSRVSAIYNRLKACDAEIRNRVTTVQNMLKGESLTEGGVDLIIPREELSKPWIFAGFLEQIFSEISGTNISESEVRMRLGVFKYYPADGAFHAWSSSIDSRFTERFPPEEWARLSKEYVEEQKAKEEAGDVPA